MLWTVSAVLAVGLGLTLVAGLENRHRAVRATATALTNLSRGVPTSLYVLAAGVLSMRLPLWHDAPLVFIGTARMFQTVALAVCVALAIGSAGHLAKILQSSWHALPRETRDQFTVLCLGRFDRIRLAFFECAPTVLPPLSARLVHHLHNTAFAALFPVVDLFGTVQGAAITSARVFQLVMLGAVAYAALSFIIWLASRAVEFAVVPSMRISLVRGSP